jgi:hypothetical protein
LKGNADNGTWADLYLVVRRAASAHHLSFPYAGKDFVLCGHTYCQTFGLASGYLTLAPLREACPFPTREGIQGDRLRLKTVASAATLARGWRIVFSLGRS